MANPPIPFEVARLRGNPGRRPLRQPPCPPQSEIPPEPPAWLAQPAQDEWRRLAPILHGLGLLTILDHAVLGAYCMAYGRMVDAAKAIEVEGYVARGSTGSLVLHPLVRIAAEASRDVLTFGSQLGLTPRARQHLRGIEAPVGRERLDDLLA